MTAHMKSMGAVAALVWVVVAPTAAQAVTVEVAKKCQAMTAKAFPPRVAGNPAAGSAQGSAKDRRDYYNKCVADESKNDDNAGKK